MEQAVPVTDHLLEAKAFWQGMRPGHGVAIAASSAELTLGRQEKHDPQLPVASHTVQGHGSGVAAEGEDLSSGFAKPSLVPSLAFEAQGAKNALHQSCAPRRGINSEAALDGAPGEALAEAARQSACRDHDVKRSAGGKSGFLLTAAKQEGCGGIY